MLELDHVRWTLPEGETIIKGVSLRVPAGKLTVVTGPNGGGKTSIAKLAAGLICLLYTSIVVIALSDKRSEILN